MTQILSYGTVYKIHIQNISFRPQHIAFHGNGTEIRHQDPIWLRQQPARLFTQWLCLRSDDYTRTDGHTDVGNDTTRRPKQASGENNSDL